MQEVFTRKEVAERLKISIFAVDDLRKQRQLGWHRVGANVRITQQNIDAFLARNEMRPTSCVRSRGVTR